MKVKSLLFLILFIVSTISAKNYKAAEIYSNQSYLYGRFEMSIKAAQGSGQLSTFFLYRNNSEQSSTLWQEIDIEIFGKNTNTFQSNVIVERTEGARLQTPIVHTLPTSLSDDFHKYVLEWTPDSISWYVDDILLRTEKVYALDCNAAMSIRLNHWAANLTSWAGVFDTSVLPQYQYVDYISYSSYTPDTGDNGGDFTFQWQDDFSTFNASLWSKANWTFGENLCDFLPANAYTENNQLVLKLHDVTPLPTKIDNIDCNYLNVYPNPFSEYIYLQSNNIKGCYIVLYSIDGRILSNPLPMDSNAEKEINKVLATQSKGTYILQVFYNNLIVESKMICKQ